MPKYTLDDFSGGLTDNVEDAGPTKLAACTNMTMTDNRKLRSRWGLEAMYNYPVSPYYKSISSTSIGYLFRTGLQTPSGGSTSRVLLYNAGTGRERLDLVYRSKYAAGAPTYDVSGRGSISVPSLASSIVQVALTAPDGSTPSGGVACGGDQVVTDRGVYWCKSGTTSGAYLYRWIDGYPNNYINACLPYLASDPNRVNSGAAGTAGNYIYYYHYYFYYTHLGKTFIDFGPVHVAQHSTSQKIGVGGYFVTHSNFTAPAAAFPGRAYPTPTFVKNHVGVAIYRTRDSGTTGYLVSAFPLFGTTPASPIADNYQDSALPVASVFPLPAVLYIDGGVEDDTEIDNVGALTFANNCTWVVRNSEPKLLYQSKPLQHNSYPGSFTTEFQEQIVELGSVDIYPIVATELGLFRVEGTVDARGVGITRSRVISNNVSVLKNTMIRVDNEVYFIAKQGFGVTDGFKYTLINSDLTELIARFSSFTQVTYEAISKKIFWLAVEGTSQSILEMDLNHKDRPVVEFYKKTDEAHDITSIEASDGFLLAGTSAGNLLKFSPYITADFSPSVLVGRDSWPKRGIRFLVKTVPLSLGERFVTKWFTKMYLFCKNFGPEWPDITAKITSYVDTRGIGQVLRKVAERGSSDREIFSIKRHFMRGRIRSRYRQIQIESDVAAVLTSSDTGTTVTTNALVPNAVLSSGSFPATIVPGMDLYLENDGYVTGYKIASVSLDTVVLQSAPPTLVGQQWEIRGYPVDELVQFEGIEFEYAPTGETIDPFRSSDGEASST